ncbi:MAG: Mov34/MPN/PAD-1 family protein [Candidatus Heimdallarchaeaceae archaeon]
MKLGKEIIEIAESAKKVLINAYLISKEREIGGFLVGMKTKKGSFLVTHCIVDYNPIEANRTTIVISTRKLYEELQVLVNTYKSIDYIGEWHTHPKGYVKLSKIDCETMKTMINNSIYGNYVELVQIICTETQEEKIYLGGYIFRNNSCKEVTLKEINMKYVFSILLNS